MLLEPPPESSMHLAWRSTKDDPPLATVPLVIHACWREPGAEHCRAVAIGLEEDQSSHSLARWTSPITIPVAIVLDVCLSCLMLGGGGA
jgi:hypothetical protein